MQSFKKKIISIAKNDIQPIEDGIHYFNNPDEAIEKLALERAEICKNCPMFVKEPVGFLAVTDKRIPILSKMMCDDCGCTLPYKTRQTLISCYKWLK